MYSYGSIVAAEGGQFAASRTFKIGKQTGYESTQENFTTKGDGNGFSYSRRVATKAYISPGGGEPPACPQPPFFSPTHYTGYYSLATSMGTSSTVKGSWKNMISWQVVEWEPDTVKQKGYYDPITVLCGGSKLIPIVQNGSGTAAYGVSGPASRATTWTDGISLQTTTRMHYVVGNPAVEKFGFESITAKDISSTATRLQGTFTRTQRTSTTVFHTYKWQANGYQYPFGGGHVSVPVYKMVTDDLAFSPMRSTTVNSWNGKTTVKTTASTELPRLGHSPYLPVRNPRRIPGAWVGSNQKKVPLYSHTSADINGFVGLAQTSPILTQSNGRLVVANTRWDCKGTSYTRIWNAMVVTMKGATTTGKVYVGTADCNADGPARSVESIKSVTTWNVPQAEQGFGFWLDGGYAKRAGRTSYSAAVIAKGNLKGATAVSVLGAGDLKPMIVPTNGAGEAEVFLHEYGKPYQAAWWSRSGPRETDWVKTTSWMSSSLAPMTLTLKQGYSVKEIPGTFAKYSTFGAVGKTKIPTTTTGSLVPIAGKTSILTYEATALIEAGDRFSSFGPGMHPNERIGGFANLDGINATVMLPPLASSAKASFAITAPTWYPSSAQNSNFWSWQILGVRSGNGVTSDVPETKTWVYAKIDPKASSSAFELGASDAFSIVRTLPMTYSDGTARVNPGWTSLDFAKLANVYDQPGFPIGEIFRPPTHPKTTMAKPLWLSYQKLVRRLG